VIKSILFKEPPFIKSSIVFARNLATLFFSICAFISFSQSLTSKPKESVYLKQLKAIPVEVRAIIQDSSAFNSWLVRYAANVKYKHVNKNVYLFYGLSQQQYELLRSSLSVQFLDVGNRKAKVEREISYIDFSVNNINNVWQQHPELNGDGLVVSVKEEAFDKTDIDLKGRILNPETIVTSSTVHASAMATIIAGAGNSTPYSRGVAGQATLGRADFSDLLPTDDEVLIAQEVSVQNHSYGVGVENYYGIEAYEYDRQCKENPAILHVFSSGNSGDQNGYSPYNAMAGFANLTGQFKTSKNTLSVGAVNFENTIASKSSRGPTYDGRVKPELVAFGDGGTSEAAALVSGIAILVQEAYKIQESALPPSSLVRAALVSSASDAGRKEVDYEYGFGIANASEAISIIKNEQYVIGSLSQAEVKSFDVVVPSGITRAKFTLAWTDAPANLNNTTALVNDLDLTLQATSPLQVWKPWTLSAYAHGDSLRLLAKRRTDKLNTLEQISIDNPVAGSYTLFVEGFSIPDGLQNFSFAYAFEKEFEWVRPAANEILEIGKPHYLRWLWSGDDVMATLEYKFSLENEWQLLADQVPLKQGFVGWLAPEKNGQVEIRITLPTVTIVSPSFLLSGQPLLKVEFTCEEESLFSWDAIDNAEAYQLYKLGNAFLEPIAVTTDTIFFVNPSLPFDELTVVPIIDGQGGLRSNLTSIHQPISPCYIKSFLPAISVTDSVQLQLSLSSIYLLSSITLQRKGIEQFIDIESLESIGTTTFFTLPDLRPLPGKNSYRVKLLRSDGLEIYSSEEDVYFLESSNMIFYPNPISSGTPLSILLNTDYEAHFELYDSQGKLVKEILDDGLIKTIETTGLVQGVYLVKAKTAEGLHIIGRLLVQ